jgi:hypothetical protein
MGTEIKDEDRIKIYGLLVDQIQKYNTIIWQAPTALIVANFVVLIKFDSPFPLLALCAFDFVSIYAFHRMVIYQGVIIKATQNTECELKKHFGYMIPEFKKFKPSATDLLIWGLWLLEFSLFCYAIYTFDTVKFDKIKDTILLLFKSFF